MGVINPEQVTIAALLLFALLSGSRGLWVFGWHYKALERERDEWRKLALTGTSLAEHVSEKFEGLRARNRGSGDGE